MSSSYTPLAGLRASVSKEHRTHSIIDKLEHELARFGAHIDHEIVHLFHRLRSAIDEEKEIMFITSNIGTPVDFDGVIIPGFGTVETKDDAYKGLSAHPSYKEMVKNGAIVESNKAPKSAVVPVVDKDTDQAAQTQAIAANSGNQAQGNVEQPLVDPKAKL